MSRYSKIFLGLNVFVYSCLTVAHQINRQHCWDSWTIYAAFLSLILSMLLIFKS